jgi:hypothetical protein
MGVRWSADLRISFELKDGQPERIAPSVLNREADRFKEAIEQGGGIFVLQTGVKAGSASVEILNQGPAEPEHGAVPSAVDEELRKLAHTAR